MKCKVESCVCNECGYCNAALYIDIDEDLKCTNYVPHEPEKIDLPKDEQ